MCVPLTVLTLTTTTILWVNSHSPERKNESSDWTSWIGEVWNSSRLELVPCDANSTLAPSVMGQRLQECDQPRHFFFFTRHSLISEISGQGLPKGDGYWRTCRTRVSWPRLKPQVLPDREQGFHSLHSPTWQCTKSRERARGEDLKCLFHVFYGVTSPLYMLRDRNVTSRTGDSDWPWDVHSMSLSLGSYSSGQTRWHLPLSW